MKYRFTLIGLLVLFISYSMVSCKSNGTHSAEWQIDSLSILDTYVHYKYLNNQADRTLVFIHPGMLDSEIWQPQINKFQKNYNILVYDMPAHGRSGLRNASLLEHDYLDQLLDFLNIHKISIIGASLGSIVATEYTLEKPKMVDQLILASPGISGEVPNDNQYSTQVNEYIRFMSSNKFPEAATCLAYIAFIGPNRPINTVNQDLLNIVKGKIYNHIEKGFWKESPYFLTPASNSRLEEIVTPTLIILGSEDYDYIKRTSSRLSEKLKNVQLEYIMNVGHLTNMENPERFNSLLKTFLESFSN